MSYAGNFGIVIGFYAVKPILLRFCRSRWAQLAAFLFLVACAVPLIHSLSTDWDNPDVSRLSPLIGEPILVLAVPLFSFLFDIPQPNRTFFPNWKWRIPLEIFVILPLWGAIWIAVEFFFLDWVWF